MNIIVYLLPLAIGLGLLGLFRVSLGAQERPV